jgi:NADPH-dependent curcumin reductase CurA
MKDIRNRQIVLEKRPSGLPGKETFRIIETDLPEMKAGEILCKNVFISVDPYMRGRMNDAGRPGSSFPLHKVIRGRTVGRVLESGDRQFSEGDYVLGMMGWEEFSIIEAGKVEKIDVGIASPSTYLGALGVTGLTAYFGLLSIAEPKTGDQVVISGAAGAVGTMVGQIARIKGCRVCGIAGTDEKVQMLREELHFDEAINYRKSGNLVDDLKKACPEGVDVYFDNVGGEISDAVMSLLNRYSRISICGQISQYNLDKMSAGPRIQPVILKHLAKMQAFTVSDYKSDYPSARKQLATWLKDGKIKSVEDITEGFENIPEAFIGLFKGENKGKKVVRIG